jgi:L-aminopeptidase/D-esterase-like protein
MLIARTLIAAVCITALLDAGQQRAKPRARDLGIPFDGAPGPRNAITDVAGVEVGATTIIEGSGARAARTGVTIVWPQGKKWLPVFAGWFAGNGFGDLTGTAWVEEGGVLGGPIAITNTNSVGTVRDAVLQYFDEVLKVDIPWHQPLVGETSDAGLNDMTAFHVKKPHVFAAMSGARTGPVPEGNVGGGTGMRALGFKGGTGTASRRVGNHTVGVLLQANFGRRNELVIAGVPVGRQLGAGPQTPPANGDDDAMGNGREGSVIVVVATDAPLLPHQLKRLARRVPMGLARVGGTASNGSGELFIAFSTANAGAGEGATHAVTVQMLPNTAESPFFTATIEAVEEAVVNALVAAETMTGATAQSRKRSLTIACARCCANTTGCGKNAERRTQNGERRTSVMRALTVTVIIVSSAAFATGSQNASVPVRERLITRNFEVNLPPHPCSVPAIVMFMAGSVEAVSGVEYRPEPCDYRTERPAPTDRINLLSMTVGQAMNTLVKIDPRYAWQESEGVIMMRPIEAWADDKHLLHESIGPIEFENKTMGYALRLLRPIIGLEPDVDTPFPAGNTPHGWHEFSVKLHVLSQLEALNEVVRAHGNLHWEVKYCAPEKRREYTRVMFWTSDKGGTGMGGGRRECKWQQ